MYQRGLEQAKGGGKTGMALAGKNEHIREMVKMVAMAERLKAR